MAGKIKQKILGHLQDFVSSPPSDAFPGNASQPHPHHLHQLQQQHQQQQPQLQPHPHHQPLTPVPGPEFPLHPCGTYPRLAHLSDGSLLAILTRRAPYDPSTRILQVSRAGPGWDRTPTPQFEPWGEVAQAKGDMDNGFIIEVPSSQPQRVPIILAAFRNHDLDPTTGRPTHFRITVCRSRDRGRTWEFAAQVAEQPGAGGKGLWEPFMRLSPSSSSSGGQTRVVHLTYSGELAHDDQETFLTTCADGGEGKTWSPQPPRCLRCHNSHRGGPKLRDGMQGIAPLFTNSDHTNNNNQKHLIMVMETTRHSHFMSVEYTLSSDFGDTWGRRGVVYCPPAGCNAGSPQIAAVPSSSSSSGVGQKNKLAVIFMTDEDIPQDHRRWPAKASVKMVFSEGLEKEGGGKEEGMLRWSYPPVEIAPEPAAWPGIVEANPAGGGGGGGRDGGRPVDEVLVSYAHGGKVVARGVRF